VNGLSALVSAALGENPYCGDVFVFRSKRGRVHPSGVARR
jgi:hypothetical protein